MRLIGKLSAFLMILVMFVPASGVLAVDDFCDNLPAGQEVPTFCQETQGETSDPILGEDGILAKVLNAISFVLIIAAVLVVIFGGYRVAFSGGKPEEAAAGRNMLLYALMGIAIALTARAIVALVLNRL